MRTAELFVRDHADRLAGGRVQLTTDGLTLYINAVENAFGGGIDYAMLTKLYGPSGNDRSPETRYSPGRIKSVRVDRVSGEPDEAHISTSYVERANPTHRMHMRGFPRLSSGFKQEALQPLPRGQPAHVLVQLHSDSPDGQDDARDGGRGYRSPLDHE